MTTKENISEIKSKSKQELDEIEILKGQLEELKAQVLKNSKESKPKNSSQHEKVDPTSYISVMSLVPYVLNLSTEGNGVGKVKRFNKFGEIKRILYSELADIIDSNMKFVEAGYFYILDSNVIRQHGLDDIYESLLTKEKINEILETGSDNSVELYKSANPRQQEVIIDLLTMKILDNPDSVNLNIIDRISRESGINIMDKVESTRSSRDGKEELVE